MDSRRFSKNLVEPIGFRWIPMDRECAPEKEYYPGEMELESSLMMLEWARCIKGVVSEESILRPISTGSTNSTLWWRPRKVWRKKVCVPQNWPRFDAVKDILRRWGMRRDSYEPMDLIVLPRGDCNR